MTFDDFEYEKTNIYVFRFTRDRINRFKNYESAKLGRKLNQDDFLEILLNLYLENNENLKKIIEENKLKSKGL